MSWQATAFVADIHDDITRSEKMLLLCLANRHNKDKGIAWASIPSLSADALMSERTCYRVLDALEAKGFITIVVRPGKTSEYQINGVDTPDTVAVVKKQNVRGRGAKTVLALALTPDISGLTPDIAMSDEPALEPKENRHEPALEPPAARELAAMVAAATSDRPYSFALYEDTIGLISGTVREELIEMEATYPAEYVRDAFTETKMRGGKNIRYVQAILLRWATEGRRPKKAEKQLVEGSARAQLLGRYRAMGGV